MIWRGKKGSLQQQQQQQQQRVGFVQDRQICDAGRTVLAVPFILQRREQRTSRKPCNLHIQIDLFFMTLTLCPDDALGNPSKSLKTHGF